MKKRTRAHIGLPLLEVHQVAYRLGVTPGYVRRLLRAKQIAFIRLGTRYRVEQADLEAFIAAQPVQRAGVAAAQHR